MGVTKTLSKTFNCFKSVSEERLMELKQNQIKKRTLAKMMWAVNAYCDWRTDRLKDGLNFDCRIWEADIKRVDILEKKSFKFTVCKFLAKVTKAKDGSDYPGRTLYHRVILLQKYLNENGKDWKLVEGKDFFGVRTVLDNLMKQRAKENIGNVVRQVQVISMQHEETLWS